jgi:MFS family permease
VLVAARILQGVGAALMAPNILSILGVVYSGPARVRAISVYGMVMGLAAVSGQLIGGILIRTDLAGLGWRAIFWINVPLGVAALLACPRFVPESRAGQGSRFDLAGVALITACLVAVVLPLVDGRQEGWPAWSWIALGSSVPLAIAFLAHQRRKAARGGVPLLNPLTTTVLSHADPATAGSVSGALSTAQQVGNSIGVAVTGVLFFGALGHGYGLAFERSVFQMGALLLLVAALTRLMPGRQRTA